MNSFYFIYLKNYIKISIFQIFYQCLQYLLFKQLLNGKNSDPKRLLVTFQATLHKNPGEFGNFLSLSFEFLILLVVNVESWKIFSKFLEIYNNGSLKGITENINKYFSSL